MQAEREDSEGVTVWGRGVGMESEEQYEATLRTAP